MTSKERRGRDKAAWTGRRKNDGDLSRGSVDDRNLRDVSTDYGVEMLDAKHRNEDASDIDVPPLGFDGTKRRVKTYTATERPVLIPNFKRPVNYVSKLKLRYWSTKHHLEILRRRLAQFPDSKRLKAQVEQIQKRVEARKLRAKYAMERERHKAKVFHEKSYTVITDGLSFTKANSRAGNVSLKLALAEMNGQKLDRAALEEEYRRRDEQLLEKTRERKHAKESRSESQNVKYIPGELKLPLLPPISLQTMIRVDEAFKEPCERVFSMYRGAGKRDFPSVAFIGKRNVGKTTLVNSLVCRHKLHKLYGQDRQHIEFLSLGRLLYLVDIPGYGQRDHCEWGDIAMEYFKANESLRKVFFLVGSRPGLSGVDRKIIDLLTQHKVDFRIVLTKTDACGPRALELTQQQVTAELLVQQMPQATKTDLLALEPSDIDERVPTPLAVSSVCDRGLARLRYEILRSVGVEG